MLDRFFPRQADNNFRGNRLALWLFAPLAFAHTAISLVAIFRADGGAQSADGIPLDSFTPQAAQAVISTIAFLGFADLLVCLFYWLALIRYRALVPLMYLVMVSDFFAHKALNALKPMERVPGTSAGTIVTLTLLVLAAIGLVLSLTGARYREQRNPA
jgi:hypothetical protein